MATLHRRVPSPLSLAAENLNRKPIWELFGLLNTLRSNAGRQEIGDDMADCQRCRLNVTMTREAVLVRLLKECLHRRVGCFKRASLHVGAPGGDAPICP